VIEAFHAQVSLQVKFDPSVRNAKDLHNFSRRCFWIFLEHASDSLGNTFVWCSSWPRGVAEVRFLSPNFCDPTVHLKRAQRVLLVVFLHQVKNFERLLLLFQEVFDGEPLLYPANGGTFEPNETLILRCPAYLSPPNTDVRITNFDVWSARNYNYTMHSGRQIPSSRDPGHWWPSCISWE
jgi:hypothetical protein